MLIDAVRLCATLLHQDKIVLKRSLTVFFQHDIDFIVVVSALASAVTTYFLFPSGEALRCYTCMGSNNDDCNRQGSKSCPSYSDACTVVVGQDSESSSDSVVAFLLLVYFLPYPN